MTKFFIKHVIVHGKKLRYTLLIYNKNLKFNPYFYLKIIGHVKICVINNLTYHKSPETSTNRAILSEG